MVKSMAAVTPVTAGLTRGSVFSARRWIAGSSPKCKQLWRHAWLGAYRDKPGNAGGWPGQHWNNRFPGDTARHLIVVALR
jgi:hypothetical protein